MATSVLRNLRLKALEPDCFNNGAIDTVDAWLYSLELQFNVNKLIFNSDHEEECAAIAAALLRGVALNWHKRLHRTGTLPITYTNLKAQLIKQFGILNEARKSLDALMVLK